MKFRLFFVFTRSSGHFSWQMLLSAIELKPHRLLKQSVFNTRNNVQVRCVGATYSSYPLFASIYS